jgi:Predicted xylanase/chitin deacetylase
MILVTEQCDWPEAVDCSYTAKSLETYQLTESDPVTIYLTFDDGPNEGTPAILQALRHHNVKATFFINSRNLHDPKPELAAQNANSLLAIIADGHVIGDHSYDHMAHNSKNSPKNAYQNVEEDSKYFGIMNTYPVLDICGRPT